MNCLPRTPNEATSQICLGDRFPGRIGRPPEKGGAGGNPRPPAGALTGRVRPTALPPVCKTGRPVAFERRLRNGVASEDRSHHARFSGSRGKAGLGMGRGAKASSPRERGEAPGNEAC